MKKQLTIIFKSLVFLLIISITINTAKAQKLLDNLTPTLAYSVRQIKTSYTGPALRVRRSNDNVLVDVYFDTNGVVSLSSQVSADGGGVATANTLATWVGTNSAYVTIWYDQSGNANDATQTTVAFQPRIVNAGVIESLPNGMPTLRMLNGGAGGNGFNLPVNVQSVSNFNLFIATRQDGNNTNGNHLFGTTGPTSGSAGKLQIHYNSKVTLGIQSATSYGSNRLAITDGSFVSSRFTLAPANNGTVQAFSTIRSSLPVTSSLTTALDATAVSIYRIGNAAYARNFEGVSPELIYFSSAVSDVDAATILNDLNTQYVSVAPVSSAASDITSTGFTANWATVAGGLLSGSTYTIQYSPNADFYLAGTLTATSATNSKAITGLDPETTYYYRVLVNTGTGGGDGGWSNVQTVTTAATPLPITLRNFTVKKADQGVDVKWSTASEINNDYFEIERSFDGKSFVSIAKINGAGSSSSTLNYSFIDKSPVVGTSYYRLKQVDKNAGFSYSNPVSIEFDLSGEKISIYPNPVADILYLNFKAKASTGYLINISDMSGKLMKSIRISGESPKVNVSDLISGTYIVAISDTSTEAVIIRTKLLKL